MGLVELTKEGRILQESSEGALCAYGPGAATHCQPSAHVQDCSLFPLWEVMGFQLGEIPGSISLDNPSTQTMREIAHNCAVDTKIKELKQL